MEWQENESPTPDTVFWFPSALVSGVWRANVKITVVDEIVRAIQWDQSKPPDSTRLPWVALPGMANVHSHAFQRGFAGLSEFRSGQRESFWTWRKRMYQFVSRMTPESAFVVARQLYLEMIAAGYTWVGEFHYLHHQAGENGVASALEMAEAIRAAAEDAGIGLCWLPVLYQRGGFNNQPLNEHQRQFQLSHEQFAQLFETCAKNWGSFRSVKLGVALHSLRAVESQVGLSMLQLLQSSHGAFPIHIHIAEQMAEVNSCFEVHQRHPVEYLLEHFDVSSDWCLIHATQIDSKLVHRISDTNAVVGLCPTTEANLGDGIFPASDFLEHSGRIGIGSDSHCSIDFREELRLLEYAQRLQTQQRAILGTQDKSVGRRLFEEAALGGAQSLGLNSGTIEVGRRADWTLVDPCHPAIASASENALLDRLIFVNAGDPIAGVVVGGVLTSKSDAKFQEKYSNSTIEFNDCLGKLGQNLC